MPSQVYNGFKQTIMSGSISLSGDTIKLALVNGYTPDIALHTTFSDVTNESSGTGYTAGGKTLTNMTLVKDDTDNEGVWTADNVEWTGITVSSDGAVLYNETYNNQLICFIDFGSTKSSSGGNFTVRWNSEGILNLN